MYLDPKSNYVILEAFLGGWGVDLTVFSVASERPAFVLSCSTEFLC